MNPILPDYISILFIATVILTLLFLFSIVRSVNKKVSTIFLLCSIVWLALTGILAISGFYLKISSNPLRFLLAAPAMLIVIILLFSNKNSKLFIKQMSVEALTYLSLIRIPVELVLWWLYLYGGIPEILTFEGRNFDIIAGITAPVVAYFCFTTNKWPVSIAWAWNFLSLVLLINIIVHAFLSLPTPLQQFSLNDPAYGILYFPIIWLPAFLAPSVLFSHLASIYILYNPVDQP